MILLDGHTLSQQILANLRLQITSHPSPITLSIILVGDDPPSLKYTSLKQRKAKEIGVDCQIHHLPIDTSSPQIANLIHNLNTDPAVTGFFIQLPIVDKSLLSLIAPQKDVDGLNPASNFIPAVVLGITQLLSHYQLSFVNKKVVIVNDSDLIGQPLLQFFPQAILLNQHTPDISSLTQTADLLISATGVKNLITADMVKEGSVVVDVANGDVDFASVAPKCSHITPTFGGVGPMTIASLFQNLVKITTDAHSTF